MDHDQGLLKTVVDTALVGGILGLSLNAPPKEVRPITTVVVSGLMLPSLSTPAAALISRRRRFSISRRRRVTRSPTRAPSRRPTRTPTRQPTNEPTRAPTRTPTRLPTRAPTNQPTFNPTRTPTIFVPFAVIPGQEFYVGGLPSEVTVGTLPTYPSVVRSGGTRAARLRDVLQGYRNANGVRFSGRLNSSVLTNGTTISDSFVNVDSLTGQITVFHPIDAAESTFVYDIVATDSNLNQAIVVYRWSYEAVSNAPDDLNRTNVPFTLELEGELYEEDDLPYQLPINGSFRFNAPASNRSIPTSSLTSLYFDNWVGDITYTLERRSNNDDDDAVLGPAPPDMDILINTAVGSIFIAPTASYTVTYALVVTDDLNRHFELLYWRFQTLPADIDVPSYGPNGRGCGRGEPIDTIEFDSHFTCDCTDTDFEGSNCEIETLLPQLELATNGQYIPAGEQATSFTFYNRTKWAWGRTYQLAPLNVTRAFTRNASGSDIDIDLDDIEFRMGWQGPTPSRGFYLDGSSGEMFISIPRLNATSHARLIVDAEDTLGVVVANITFAFMPEDINNPSAVGPNGRDCGSTGRRTDTYDGESEFDLRFTCQCSGRLIGENCDEEPAVQGSQAQAQPAQDNSIAISAISAIIGVLLIAVAVTRYQVYRARRRPENMSEVQEEILAGLGLGGAALSVRKDEIGLSLKFGQSMARQAIDSENDDLASQFAEDLLAVLRGLSGLPTRFATMLKDKGTTVDVEPSESAALVRMKKRQYELKDGAEESFATALQKRADARKVSIHGQHFVQEVSVAIPKRVPAELERDSILRLALLGEGNFGEVYKATFTAGGRGSVALTAAVKTLKTTESSARVELLREAAFMALFEHPNLVSIIGVVTAPRNMPVRGCDSFDFSNNLFVCLSGFVLLGPFSSRIL